MRFFIMTDIEGVTGVTTYAQAENSQLGRDMLMNDLLAVIEGIRTDAHHDIVVYDMHTDGRNIDITLLPEDVQVIMGKPINGQLYKGVNLLIFLLRYPECYCPVSPTVMLVHVLS